jgi:hypothetical protein
LVIPLSSRSSCKPSAATEHQKVDDQKQDALDKAKAELESIGSKLAESAVSLKEAQKGRENTVSVVPSFSVSSKRREKQLIIRMNERNYLKPLKK